MSVLIVAPTKREARGVGEKCIALGARDESISSLELAIAERKPDTIIIAGLCGGLDPALKKGTLVFARQIEGVGTESTCVPEKMIFESGRRALRSAGLSFVTSKLVTQQNVVVTTTEKLALWNEYGAAGVDMETLPLIQVAEKANIRWLVLRAVIDTASMTLPETLSNWENEEHERGIKLKILQSPSEWTKYLQLAHGLRLALKSLRTGVPIIQKVAEDTVSLDMDILAQ
mgnify:FL=1